MKSKECKITCDGKEIATINCTENGLNIKCTGEGMKMCKDFKSRCC